MADKVDIAVTLDASGRYDFTIADGDFVADNGFSGALYSSLFSDRRASADQVPPAELRRGWMGDVASPVQGREFGSHLWLIEQARLTDDTLNDGIDFARSALQWLVEDGVAKDLQVDGSIIPRQGIQLEIIITALDGSVETRYVKTWEGTIDAD